MTKVTILGADTQDKKELKKIEFVYSLSRDFSKLTPSNKPHEWANITLIRKGYSEDGLDLMYAYDDDDACRLYLGHFNDGVV